MLCNIVFFTHWDIFLQKLLHRFEVTPRKRCFHWNGHRNSSSVILVTNVFLQNPHTQGLHISEKVPEICAFSCLFWGYLISNFFITKQRQTVPMDLVWAWQVILRWPTYQIIYGTLWLHTFVAYFEVTFYSREYNLIIYSINLVTSKLQPKVIVTSSNLTDCIDRSFYYVHTKFHVNCASISVFMNCKVW